jgi:hypothetical protein
MPHSQRRRSPRQLVWTMNGVTSLVRRSEESWQHRAEQMK